MHIQINDDWRIAIVESRASLERRRPDSAVPPEARPWAVEAEADNIHLLLGGILATAQEMPPAAEAEAPGADPLFAICDKFWLEIKASNELSAQADELAGNAGKRADVRALEDQSQKHFNAAWAYFMAAAAMPTRTFRGVVAKIDLWLRVSDLVGEPNEAMILGIYREFQNLLPATLEPWQPD